LQKLSFGHTARRANYFSIAAQSQSGAKTGICGPGSGSACQNTGQVECRSVNVLESGKLKRPAIVVTPQQADRISAGSYQELRQREAEKREQERLRRIRQ